jgi:hypothetical protein
MEDWNSFYMLIGGTAGTLIGLIFVVITLGMDHAQRGDEVRTRIFITPILVYFTTLLVISLVMVAPTQAEVRAVALVVIGCAGFLYATSLAFMARRRTDPDTQELLWDILFPLASFLLIAVSGALWWFNEPAADETSAIGMTLLLVTALRNSWVITLAIGGR